MGWFLINRNNLSVTTGLAITDLRIMIIAAGCTCPSRLCPLVRSLVGGATSQNSYNNFTAVFALKSKKVPKN